jgi:hypothetical protein
MILIVILLSGVMINLKEIFTLNSELTAHRTVLLKKKKCIRFMEIIYSRTIPAYVELLFSQGLSTMYKLIHI